MRNIYTEAQTRAWLTIRSQAFTPRIKRIKPTKAKPYTFTLDQLAADMSRTLDELLVRIAEGKSNEHGR